MKNYLRLGTACIIVIAFVIYMKANRNEITAPLLLNNIEALAAGEEEEGDAYCIGSGSVDCPIDHSKVKYVFEPYSLGW